ncbi:MAG: hypothetical protein EAZ36_07420 [Verrucomicrobia bacterium]|nr:MAG: hypothetical protein EAZ36_07420 [Verrucomicrobiota bacterium]
MRLLSPHALVERGALRMDDLRNRLESAAARAITARHHEAALWAGRLATASPERRLEREGQRLLGLSKRLQSASPASVLNRGFALVRDAKADRPLMRAQDLRPGQRIGIEFGDGRAHAQVTETPASGGPRRASANKDRSGG